MSVMIKYILSIIFITGIKKNCLFVHQIFITVHGTYHVYISEVLGHITSDMFALVTQEVQL